MTATLPSPPRALAAILDAAKNPDVPFETMSKAVQADPSFAATLIRVVNTPRYQGRRGRITNVRMATMRLGIRTLRNLAVCHAAQSVVSAKQLGDFDLQTFWEGSLQRAVAAEILAAEIPETDASEAFTTGLLLELGVLALVLEDPSRATQIAAWIDKPWLETLEAERAAFGASRADVARGLADEWNLPSELGIPMALAHAPDRAPHALQARCRLVALARTVGRVLAKNVDRGQALQTAREQLASQLNFTTERTDELIDALGEKVAASAQVMGFRVGKQPTLDDILQEANRSLVDMNLSYEDLVSKLEQTLAEKQKLAEELDKRNQELERLSRTDVLTQLPNRRVLFTEANKEVLRTARDGSPVAMVVGDIDFFKQFNDRHGHVFGDVVLKAVANALADSVRAVDTAARAGGEEFALLLPNTALPQAQVVADRARKAIEAISLTAPDGSPSKVTMSFGVAVVQGPYRKAHDVDAVVTRLYQTADEALYEAKESGRNRVIAGPSVGWQAEEAARRAG